jgi:hypothetical protein
MMPRRRGIGFSQQNAVIGRFQGDSILRRPFGLHGSRPGFGTNARRIPGRGTLKRSLLRGGNGGRWETRRLWYKGTHSVDLLQEAS